jgi:hypothetical protein
LRRFPRETPAGVSHEIARAALSIRKSPRHFRPRLRERRKAAPPPSGEAREFAAFSAEQEMRAEIVPHTMQWLIRRNPPFLKPVFPCSKQPAGGVLACFETCRSRPDR